MILQTPTNNLALSKEFYEKLNFQFLKEDTGAVVTDGKLIMEINPVRYARAGAKLYAPDWSEKIESLQQLTPVHLTKEGAICSDGTGSWIYLINGEEPAYSIHGEPTSVLGNYMGLSLETLSMEKSQKVWEILGFSVSMGGPDQGWMAMSDDHGGTISLMKPNACPHLFFNPSLTFFNGKNNPAIIAKIRELGIPITEEITHFNKEGIVDNIIIRDPGGFGFFIFND